MDDINKIIDEIKKKMTNNNKFIKQHKQRPQDFTRKHETTPTDDTFCTRKNRQPHGL